MKIYLLFLLPKNKLYAITDNKKFLKQFLSERNSNIFNIVTKSYNEESMLELLEEYKLLKLHNIPLEDSNGDYEIIGTLQEDNLLSDVCERFDETCRHLKLHFTKNVPFKNEYKYILDSLTTINKNINNHPIIQIDSVKLFYYLFKETFVDISNSNDIYISDDEFDIIEKFKAYY